MNPEIFREYDLRGVYNKDFDLHDVNTLGRGYGTYLARKGGSNVVVGRDCRVSSPEVKEALVSGLCEAGMDVVDIGICPTPLLYYALRRLNPGGGVMITASHNPPEYNGFKTCLGHDNIFGQEIQAFRQLVESRDFAHGSGTLIYREIIDDYMSYIINNINISRPVKVGVDAGNGTGGLVAGPLLTALGCPPQALFFEPDGAFPNHIADPTVSENMESLAQLVVREGLELGIGFDGDADRIGVVDEKGRLIYGDMLMLIFAREILKTNPGAKFVAEVKCSQNLFNDLIKRGGHPIMWKAGHSLMKNKLKEEDALLAGEMSGHIFFKHRYFGFDDAIYAACRLLEIVAEKQEPLSEYLKDLPVMHNTPEIRLPCPDHRKFVLVDLVKAELGKTCELIDVDGLRVVFPDGWGLLRASNTGPMIVMRFEAETRERLEEIRALVEGTIHRLEKNL
jgi:phosphomannomutase/phosphoglucomutase